MIRKKSSEPQVTSKKRVRVIINGEIVFVEKLTKSMAAQNNIFCIIPIDRTHEKCVNNETTKNNLCNSKRTRIALSLKH